MPHHKKSLRLSLPTNPTKADVESEYRKAALALHPDKGGNEEDFKELVKERDDILLEIEEKNNVKGRTDVSSHRESNLFTKNEVKKTTEQHYNVTSYRIKFNPGTSSLDKLTAIFSGLNDKPKHPELPDNVNQFINKGVQFGFPENAKIGETRSLTVNGKDIGQVIFGGIRTNIIRIGNQSQIPTIQNKLIAATPTPKMIKSR